MDADHAVWESTSAYSAAHIKFVIIKVGRQKNSFTSLHYNNKF